MNTKPLLLILASVPLLALAACQNGHHTSLNSNSISISHAWHIEEFKLSLESPLESPSNKDYGIRLISITRNRKVTIERLDTHHRFSATPGHAFISKKFGMAGCVLKSASPSRQTATFYRTYHTPY